MRLAECHTLAECVDGPAMDRRGNADGPAGLPPRQRLPPLPKLAAGSTRRKRATSPGWAGGRRSEERHAGRVAGQAPPESAAGAGSRPSARKVMHTLFRNRPKADHNL